MQIGIIGTGQMGGMLARAFAQTASEDVYIYNRSHLKADAIADEFPNLVVCENWHQLVDRVDAVFLCVKPKDGTALMRVLGPALGRHQLLVTTISTVDLDRWRELTSATPIKLIPSLTQTVMRGALLLSYPRNTPEGTRNALESRLARIGKPHVIDEAQIRVCSDLTSCGPAFLSTLCLAWAQAASQTGNITRQDAEQLLEDMLIGLAKLLDEGMSFEEVVGRIRVPGGVTESGIDGLGELPIALFSRLHDETMRHAQGHTHAAFRAGMASPRS